MLRSLRWLASGARSSSRTVGLTNHDHVSFTSKRHHRKSQNNNNKWRLTWKMKGIFSCHTASGHCEKLDARLSALIDPVLMIHSRKTLYSTSEPCGLIWFEKDAFQASGVLKVTESVGHVIKLLSALSFMSVDLPWPSVPNLTPNMFPRQGRRSARFSPLYKEKHRSRDSSSGRSALLVLHLLMRPCSKAPTAENLDQVILICIAGFTLKVCIYKHNKTLGFFQFNKS